MKENILFKDASKNLVKLTNLLQTLIKGSVFENKVCYVGGCVRDLILGNEPKNIDIVVNKENGGIELAYFLAMRLGIETEGNIDIISSQYGASLEISNDKDLSDFYIKITQTCNSRYQNETREPKEIFGTFEQDALRRDFTINALYWNISQECLYDFTKKGIDDLRKKIIRCPYSPSLLFYEDPSRIVRAVRFSNNDGWGIESETWLGMVENSKELLTSDFVDEFIEVLLFRNPTSAMRRLYHCGALEYMIPDVYDLCSSTSVNGNNLFEETLKVMKGTTTNVVSRLAALFHKKDEIMYISNPNFAASVAKNDVRALGFSVDTAENVSKTILNYKKFDNYGNGVMPTDRIMKKFVNRCGGAIYSVIDLMNASYNNRDDVDKKKPKWVLDKVDEIMKTEKDKKSIALPINGKDIMREFNLKKGPHIGILLNVVKDAVTDNPNITKDQCFNLVRDKIHTLSV